MSEQYRKDLGELVRTLEEITQTSTSGNSVRYMVEQALREQYRREASRATG